MKRGLACVNVFWGSLVPRALVPRELAVPFEFRQVLACVPGQLGDATAYAPVRRLLCGAKQKRQV